MRRTYLPMHANIRIDEVDKSSCLTNTVGYHRGIRHPLFAAGS
ncbi:MAG: hypothetical protein ACE5F8_04890 [Woeseiaceae bacterium]